MATEKAETLKSEIDHIVAQWGVPLAIAVVAALVRMIAIAERPTLLAVVRGVLVGVFVGAVVNLYLTDLVSVGPGARGAIVGVAAILSEDLVIGLIKLGRAVRDNPELLLPPAWRGKK